MENYPNIIKRIKEIIKESETAQKEKDPNAFTRILWFNILKEHEEEFTKLIDIERTLHLYYNTNEPLKINQQLSNLLETIKDNDAIELNNIINQSLTNNPEDLIEHLGYFIPKEHFERFKELCKKLRVGTNTLIKSTTNAQEIIKESLNNNKNQYQRITTYLKENEQIQETTKYPKNSFINQNNQKQEIPHITAAKHKELLYLIKIGKLKLTDIINLQNVMTNEEYQYLLEELKTYQIISIEQEAKLKGTKITNITDINELLNFFITKKDIQIDGLKELIPAIGKDNYDYLVDELFRHNALTITEYKKYLDDLINTPSLK